MAQRSQRFFPPRQGRAQDRQWGQGQAYLHVHILPAHREECGFCHAGRHYQYCALLFGLSSASRVFTKIMAALVPHLQTRLIWVQFYLDDLLILSSSEDLARRDLNYILQVLRDHSFSINKPKSHLIPQTCIQHLGVIIDTVKSRVYLSPEHLASLRLLVRKERTGIPITLLLSQLLGKMISCIGIVPWAHLHCRAQQWFLLPYQWR